MLQAQERNDIQPICPHCEQPIGTLAYQEVKTTLGKRYLYFCSACRKTLGISHRKGFWMG
ncbi:MAG: hypothetical protein HWD86_06870 [Kangiellaceae bacterium]|nr:hypothetical protein [Kangiellaceae bacterium]